MQKVTLQEANLESRKAEIKLLHQLVECLDEDDTMRLAELVAYQGVTPVLMARAIDQYRMAREDNPYDDVVRQNCSGLNPYS